MAFQFTQTGQELQYLADEAEKIAAEYDAAASWTTGDYCTHEGVIYRCTAFTTGTFDATKWTAVILCDELEGLRTRMSTAEGDISALNTSLTQSQTWVTPSALSASLYNCAGTITGSMNMAYTTDKKLALVWGRIRITSFSRTGGNPGVILSLPFTHDRSFPIGYRGESPVEQVNLSFVQGRLTTTESYSNATGSVLTLMVPATIVPLI